MLHREVSVSWATTLIVCPCPKFPITPHLLPLSFFFFFPSLVVHKAPSWVKRTGFFMKASVCYSRVLFSWLTWEKKTKKNNEVKKHPHMNCLCETFLKLPVRISTTDPAVYHEQCRRSMGKHKFFYQLC